MMQILIVFTLGSLLGVPWADAQCCAPAPQAAENNNSASLTSSSTAGGSTVTLKVTGMTCDKCVASVQKALQSVEGVKAAEVSLDKG